MKLTELPALTFARADPTELDASIVSTVESILGRTLARADPLRIFLRGIELVILQQRLLIDECAKQNLLAYATGSNLEHLGALVGLERFQPVAAFCTVSFKLSAPRELVTILPAGMRLTAGDQRYFATDEDIIFLKGETEKTAQVTCLEKGSIGNGYAIGELNQIVDPQPFLMSARNITESAGGSDIETDAAFRARIHAAPELFSNAGSFGAYKYHTLNVSPLIADVSIVSPAPGEVMVYPLLTGGELPTAEIIRSVEEALNDRAIRPLTDKVQVLSPAPVPYDIDCEFYINRSDATSAAAIELRAEQAVADYILWQKSALGRDIEPTELIHRLKAAGVKRVHTRYPRFTVLQQTQVGIVRNISAVYMGLEAD